MVDLVEQRDAILERVGALETQRKIVGMAVDLSDGAAGLLQDAQNADEGISSFIAAMASAKGRIEALTDRGE